jgi:hypothetical protein
VFFVKTQGMPNLKKSGGHIDRNNPKNGDQNENNHEYIYTGKHAAF